MRGLHPTSIALRDALGGGGALCGSAPQQYPCPRDLSTPFVSGLRGGWRGERFWRNKLLACIERAVAASPRRLVDHNNAWQSHRVDSLAGLGHQSAWLDQANAHPMEVLIDHAHCERKAAGSAVQMMFRYLCEPGLGEVLSPLAREELEHFEQVLAVLQSRGRYLEPLPAPAYGGELARRIRKVEPERMLDSFLVAGLIEARSHERMALLAEHSPDPDLRGLYGDLLASEARHFGVYWTLANRVGHESKSSVAWMNLRRWRHWH